MADVEWLIPRIRLLLFNGAKMAVASNKCQKIIISQLRCKFIVFSFEVCEIDLDRLEPQALLYYPTTEVDVVLFLTEKILVFSLHSNSTGARTQYGKELCHLQSS